MINLAGLIAKVAMRALARALPNGLNYNSVGLFSFASGATGGFATLAYAPRVWRIALYGTDAALELNGHERLSLTPREGEAWVKDFPKTDIEHAELAAFAAAITGGPAYPLPVEDAIHGVAVFEAMIGAAAPGSTYRVA